ncbi:MAG: HAD-IIA family hydrolase [Chthonomonas sp.]|nr:HAD-IIA family hydrolase [Chthonomonas sp.]
MSWRGVIFDLDGTLYRGSEPIPRAAHVVQTLRDRGVPMRCLTNNSSATPESVAAKLAHMGFEFAPAEIATSGTVTADALAAAGVERVFVVGEAGLVEVLARQGIVSCEPGDAQVVVAGICRQFSYDWLDRALQAVRGGAELIATNRDTTFPLEGGRLAPGAGAIVAALEACTGCTARAYGKPDPAGVLALCADMGLAPNDVLCVGDRLDTDIAAGEAAGCPTFLVTTGVTPALPVGVPGGRLEDLVER